MTNGTYILLVEDNADDEVLTLRALRKNNFTTEVVIVRDGAEALDFLFATGNFSDRNKNQLPRVVLLDLKLPKLDGLQVLKRIRTEEHTRMLPVVVLTTSKEEIDVASSYDLGANSYVRKPVDFVEFAETVRNLGTYWLQLNEFPQAHQTRVKF